MNKKLLCSLLGALVSVSTFATVHNVSVSSNVFTPSNLVINEGDTVIWTNMGGNHNVNGSTTTYPSNPASFSNGGASSAMWTYQFVFHVPGNYSYQCDPHVGLGMTGTITVNALSTTSDLILTGVIDGPLPGGLPKAVELYATAAIADLSEYGVARASGGSGSLGQAAYVMPPASATQGQFIYITDDSAGFNNFFGFDADYVDTNTSFDAIAGNGDDAYELYRNNIVVDVMGDVNVDGTGEPWEYLDSWAYRLNGTGPDGSTFILPNWTFGGPNVLDNETSNATAATPFPIGTYSPVAPPAPSVPIYSVATITTNDVDNIPDSLNVNCGIEGIVFSIDFDGNNGYSFYLDDGTGGINVFSFNDVSGYTSPMAGDSLTVWGIVAQFNGLTELIPDSIRLNSTGNAIPSPSDVTTLDETTEGEYIELRDFSLVNPAQWPTTGNDANLEITNGNDTLVMRIDRDTDIDGTPAPTGSLIIRGAGTQFDGGTVPLDSGYQILPSSLLDIIEVPSYTIADVTGFDPVTGEADSLGVICELRGTVFTIDFDGNAGYQIYMYDQTGGINVFSFSDVSGYTNPQIGDSLRIVGEILQFRGLTEIGPYTVLVEATGVPLKSPEVVTTLDESTESEYIRLNGFTLVDPSQWPTSSGGSGVNLDITNGHDTLVMRIDSDTDIYGNTTPPAGAFDIIGVGGQFDSNPPLLDNHQIFPRDSNDIIPVDLPQLAITEIMPNSGHPASINGDWFEVTNYGTTSIDLLGFSWDDESREAGKHTVTTSVVLPAGVSAIFLEEENPDDADWAQSWAQAGNNIIILNENDEFVDFSGFSSNGDEVSLWDDGFRLLSCVAYDASDVNAGFSIEVDNSGNILGSSVNGVNGAYTSADSDVGSPGNLPPFSLRELTDDRIELYPNPTSDVVFINTGSNATKNIQLISLVGRVVYSNSTTDEVIEINLNSVPAGIYIVSVDNGEEKITAQLIVE